MRRIFYLLLFLMVCSEVYAQDDPQKEIDLDVFIQQLFPLQNEDLPYEELYESLFQYYQNPLDLNTARREELASLYILSELQLNNFMEYRGNQGKFISIYELQTISGFDKITIDKLSPFVKVEEAVDYKNLIQDFSERDKFFILKYETTVEKKKGYEKGENRYNGDPGKIYGRFRATNSKHYSVGLTFEKDAGENLKWNPPGKKYGFDYFSGHIFLKNKGKFKSMVLGDYQLQFGQGLLLGAGFFPGKGAEAVSTLRRYNIGIRPYSSVVESGFFRGGAATYSFGTLDFTAFYSYLNEDAASKTDSLDEDYVRSIQISGLHRTATELSSRKEMNTQNYGGNLTYNLNKNLNVGITFLATEYEFSIIKKPNRYNQFDFSGKRNFVYSFNYSYLIQNFNFFGEAAQSKSRGIGIVSGVMASLSPKIDMSVVYRNYARNFHSFYGNGFGENSKNSNEEGLYLGVKFAPINKIILTAYFDRFYKPWLSYQTYAPSHGNECLLRLSYLPAKTINFYVQLRNQVKEKNTSGEDSEFASMKEESATNFLLNLDFKPFKSLQLKSRFQSSEIKQGNYHSKGMAIIQDVVFEVGKFKISGRYCIFDTDDYASRQYAYERDLLYTFSVPALHGNGIRNYLMIEYNLTRSIDFWVRASRTTYSNVETISSGLEEIKGNKKTDLKFQVRYRF